MFGKVDRGLEGGAAESVSRRVAAEHGTCVEESDS